MRIDLRDDEVIDVEHFGETRNGEIVVDGPVNPPLGRRIPRDLLAGSRILGLQLSG